MAKGYLYSWILTSMDACQPISLRLLYPNPIKHPSGPRVEIFMTVLQQLRIEAYEKDRGVW